MKKITIDRLMIIFLVFIPIVLLIYNLTVSPYQLLGEWDDYALPTISIINEQNFSISESDTELAKQYFPMWEKYIENHSLSSYFAKDGGEMSWYFPTYSILCIPIILFLRFLKIDASFAFIITNWLLYIGVLWVIYKKCNLKKSTKYFLLAVLTINPIVFYIKWLSAEVLIYACLVFTMFYWLTGKRKLSALFCAIGGTLNPTILALGLVMIVDFFLALLKKREEKMSAVHTVYFLFKNWREIVSYGIIYVIGLIPMVYNYYNVGHINLTASLSVFTEGTETTMARFWAYLFDLNFGIFPYYGIMLILSFVLFFIAIIKKRWEYILPFGSFFLVTFAYSFMVHINCGVSGLHRYCVWSIVILLFTIFYFVDMLVDSDIFIKIVQAIYTATVILLAVVIYNYGPVGASKVPYTSMTPIAQYVLDNVPQLYNPLGSTFNRKINHFSGLEGYTYDTPIYYTDSKGNVRKILTKKADIDILEKTLVGDENALKFLNEEYQQLKDEETYINISKKYTIKNIQ